ncbi:MAG TPA: nuclear transport factor 2 family protein [Frankiaceae bacterium]|jgi:hypothetical protein|nr:nuclear transport factor 2 family protein [Frankiaceae bacterium]
MDEPVAPETFSSVSRLLGQYCLLLDSGHFEEWTALFVAQGRLQMKRHEVVGHDELLVFAQEAPRGIHLCGVPVVSTSAEGAVSSVCPWNFVDLATGTQVVGYYHDDVVWSGGRHRFTSRRIEMHFPPARKA